MTAVWAVGTRKGSGSGIVEMDSLSEMLLVCRKA